jgi:hypothetical protein
VGRAGLTVARESGAAAAAAQGEGGDGG